MKRAQQNTDQGYLKLARKAVVGMHFIRKLQHGEETLCLDKVNQELLLFGHEQGPNEIKSDK